MILSVGTPLWKMPNVEDSDAQTNTLCALPSATTTDHSEFAGVTVRDGEDSDHQIHVQQGGDIYVRVLGPIDVGDSAQFSAGNDYLVAGADGPVVGKSLQANADGAVKLIKVRTASSGGGDSDGVTPRWG